LARADALKFRMVGELGMVDRIADLRAAGVVA